MNSQDVLSKLQGNYDMDAGAIDNIINSATASFDNNWRSKLSEQIGLDEDKKEQIDELTASTGLGLQMGKEAYKKIQARRAKLAEGKATKLKEGTKDIKEDETTDLDGKTPESQTAPETAPEVDPATVDDGSGSAVKSTKTLETVDEEPLAEASSSVPEVSSEGVGSGESMFGSGVDPTAVDLDEVEGATRGASLRFGVSGIRPRQGFNMEGTNVEPRLPDYNAGQGIETGDVAPSRIAYPESWSNNSEISSDFFSGKPTISSVSRPPVPEAPPVEEATPASAPETTAVLDTGEEGTNIAINAGKTALKSGLEDAGASASEALTGAIGAEGMTALGIAGDLAPPVAILAGVGLGIYDLFHHEHAPHDPPKAPAISTALSRHGLVMPSSDGVVDVPASASAF